jgi:hypothetical protein
MPKRPAEKWEFLVVNREISLNNMFEENYRVLSERVLKNPDDYLRDENYSINVVMKGVKNAGR